MKTLSTYLTFNGNSEEAFNFYHAALGGKLELHRFKDMPDGDKLPAADQSKIMHVSLALENNLFLMASDTIESMPGCHKVTAGNNFSISISADSEEEAVKLFNTLSAGGSITMPLEKTFWSAYFGMFIDKFGIQWMVNYDYPQS